MQLINRGVSQRTTRLVLFGFCAGIGAIGCLELDEYQGETAQQWKQSSWAVHRVCGRNNTKTAGIDVSSWQDDINWAAVKEAGIVFAFIRVSDGIHYFDKKFDQNWKGSKAAGIIRGPYQFFRPNIDATAQAQLFVNKINESGGLEKSDLPGVIDVEKTENLSGAQIAATVKTWIAYVEAHTGRRPIIYSGSYFWDDNNIGPDFSSYPLWGPHYTNAECPLISDKWTHWTFWQYTSEGRVNGISGNVDRNHFDGNLEQLQQFIKSTDLQPEPEPEPGPEPGPEPQPDAAPRPDVYVDSSFDTSVTPEAAATDSNPLDRNSDAKSGRDSTGSSSLDNSDWIQDDAQPDGCACRAAGHKRPREQAWWLAALAMATILLRKTSSRVSVK